MKRLAIAFAAFLVAAPSTFAQGDVLVYATNQQGSLAFIAGSAIAKVVDDKLKLQIRVLPTAGTSTFIPMLNRNEVDLGGINVEEVQTAFAGSGPFEGKANANIRVVSTLFPLPLGILVPADSSAKSIADLKGARLPGGYAGQTTARATQAALLANAGLSMADMREVPVVNQFAATEALGAGRLDAVSITVGVAQVQKAHADLAARGGVRFLSLDTGAAAVARMQPHVRSRPILYEPAPANVGIVGPTWVMGYSYFLTTHAQTKDTLAYALAKVLHESHEDLKKITPTFNRFDPKRMTEITDPVPWHPGAIKFFAEIGQWPPKD